MDDRAPEPMWMLDAPLSECGWCHRLTAERLGQGEICEVCVGLAAFGYLERVEVAAALYRPAYRWAEQLFELRRAEPEPGCWWCGRPGRQVRRLAGGQPTLCPVCEGLLVEVVPPPGPDLLRARRAWAQLCLAVAS